MILAKFDNVGFKYDDKIVLENVSFDLEREDFIILKGENGSGKSTILKGLIGIIKPYKGEIQRPYKDKKIQISYISQQKSYMETFPASVWEVVLSGRVSLKKGKLNYSNLDKEICDMYMEKFKLKNIKEESFKNLSGGQKQKALLARALASEGEIFVLDEPTSGLDQDSKEEIYNILMELNLEDKKTILMVSHDDRLMPDFVKMYIVKNKSLVKGDGNGESNI